MRDDRTERQIAIQGAESAAILESPAFARAVASMRQRLFEEFEAQEDPDLWLGIWARLKAVNGLEGEFNAEVGDGMALTKRQVG